MGEEALYFLFHRTANAEGFRLKIKIFTDLVDLGMGALRGDPGSRIKKDFDLVYNPY